MNMVVVGPAEHSLSSASDAVESIKTFDLSAGPFVLSPDSRELVEREEQVKFHAREWMTGILDGKLSSLHDDSLPAPQALMHGDQYRKHRVTSDYLTAKMLKGAGVEHIPFSLVL